MRIARKAVTLLTLAALLCGLLATAAFAAENGALWLTVEENEGTSALIITDAVVTDGVVKLTYDSEMLTYESTEITEGYVAMYAVNAEEQGVVLISWVAPGAYALEDGAVCLIRVNFSGREQESTITLTGSVHDQSGSELNFADAPDTAGLAEAIADAQALDEGAYTEDTWAALEKALTEAKAVLANSLATQSEVDAAEKAVRDAVEALVKIPAPTETEGTEDPTESSATGGTEEPEEPSSTKATEDSGDNANTGDQSGIWVFVVIAVLSAAAIVVLMIKMKSKKGGDAE